MALVPRQRLLFCHTATSESLLICSCVSTSAAITEELPASCSTPRALIPTRIRRSEAGRDGRPQSGGRAGSRACGQLRMGGDPGVCGGGTCRRCDGPRVCSQAIQAASVSPIRRGRRFSGESLGLAAENCLRSARQPPRLPVTLGRALPFPGLCVPSSEMRTGRFQGPGEGRTHRCQSHCSSWTEDALGSPISIFTFLQRPGRTKFAPTRGAQSPLPPFLSSTTNS